MDVYEMFSKGVVAKEFTAHKKEEFLKLVKTLDQEAVKTFLLIVKVHEIKHIPDSQEIVPYAGVSDGSKIAFDLDKIPALLQNILFKFMEMYTKNKQVEMERQVT